MVWDPHIYGATYPITTPALPLVIVQEPFADVVPQDGLVSHLNCCSLTCGTYS